MFIFFRFSLKRAIKHFWAQKFAVCSCSCLLPNESPVKICRLANWARRNTVLVIAVGVMKSQMLEFWKTLVSLYQFFLKKKPLFSSLCFNLESAR